jgi:hypothetical protein
MKKLLFIQIALCSLFQTTAQQHFYQSQNLSVTKNEVDLINPWAGGANVPQLSPIDLNGDDILDLVIFDKNGDQINCFINNGTPNTVDYHYSPEFNTKFPELKDWVLLRDYNCDGKADIFTSNNGGIRLYKNTSIDSDLSFELIGTILTDRGSGPTNLYVSSVDIPHIGDLDYDGDIDILTFTVIGSHVEWHKNNSLENFGHCDSLSFELADECWGDFSENFSNNSVTLNDCEPLKGEPIASKHSGSTVTALDLNGDTFFELLLGDITFDNMVMLQNSAPTEDALMVDQDLNFPSYNTSINLTKFPAAYHLDINNDNKKDLIVSPNGNNVSHNFENIWFYENISPTVAVDFNLTQKNLLLDEMIEVGSGAHPVFFDYNNDSLMDLIVANYGYYTDGGNYNSQLALYKNIGTIDNPKFEWVTDDYSNLGTINFETNLVPTFGDLDNDGDKDMIIGDSNGKIHLLDNINVNDEAFFFLNSIDYFGIDVGSFASPFLVDLDRDEDLDLIIGSRHGHIAYYENQGNINEADFTLINDTLGNIQLTDAVYNTAYTTPTIIDGENGYELYVGTEKGNIHHYTNIESDILGEYTEIADSLELYSNGIKVSPAVYDLNNDGWHDMLLGTYTGGIHLLWGADINNFSTSETTKNELHIAPNPSTGIIYIEDVINIKSVKICNLSGQCFNREVRSNKIDLSDLPKGIYFISASTEFGHVKYAKICII